jgi:hypothetical protein
VLKGECGRKRKAALRRENVASYHFAYGIPIHGYPTLSNSVPRADWPDASFDINIDSVLFACQAHGKCPLILLVGGLAVKSRNVTLYRACDRISVLRSGVNGQTHQTEFPAPAAPYHAPDAGQARFCARFREAQSRGILECFPVLTEEHAHRGRGSETQTQIRRRP